MGSASGPYHMPVPGRGSFRPKSPVIGPGAVDATTGQFGHPVVNLAVEMIANTVELPPADQIAQYEAAYRMLQDTLATIDQA